MNLINQLYHYQKSTHICAQEKDDASRFITFIQNNPGCFDREHKGHVTGSAWIVNHDFTHALLTHHRKLNMWLQLGGHADGNPDIQSVALREAWEESGIDNLNLVIPEIFDISIHPIPGPCTYHYDVRYLLRSGAHAQFVVSEESHNLAWITMNNINDSIYLPEINRMNQKFITYFKNKIN